MAFGYEQELKAEIARLLAAGDRLESQMIEACRERDRLRLTDAEREALWTAAEAYAENDGDPERERIATALHGLWQRTRSCGHQ